jgi:hypothetical protein
MDEVDFWDLVFVAAIISGASVRQAEINADKSVDIRRARANGGKEASDKSGT